MVWPCLTPQYLANFRTWRNQAKMDGLPNNRGIFIWPIEVGYGWVNYPQPEFAWDILRFRLSQSTGVDHSKPEQWKKTGGGSGPQPSEITSQSWLLLLVLWKWSSCFSVRNHARDPEIGSMIFGDYPLPSMTNLRYPAKDIDIKTAKSKLLKYPVG